MFFVLLGLVCFAGIGYFLFKPAPVDDALPPSEISTPIPTAVSANPPENLPLGKDPLNANIIAAGDYLMRQQLANGELAYQVNVMTGDRSSTPSNIRLMSGVSALYTVCRVSGKTVYCEAGDRALSHLLPNLLTDSQHFKGTCLYSNGSCPLGGASEAVDAIYKRWQAADSVLLEDRNLLTDAVEFGYFIVSMRRPEGGFYHSFNPHFGGTVNPGYYDPAFNGEGIAALLQLYEMTGNEFWLGQAREVNGFLLTQPVTEDHGYSYALALFARLDALDPQSQVYAKQIADLIIAGQVRSLNPSNSSFATATKIEALSSLAQAFAFSEMDSAWLEPEIHAFVTFVQARQLPANDCSFTFTENMMTGYKGGLFNTCADPTIRVDGIQHWVNGLTMYLEYLGMSEK